MMGFDSFQSCDKFRTHESINSWFSSLSPWTPHFVVQDRIVWIDVEGIPLRAWSKTTFNRIARKWGELVFMDDSNNANKYSLRICVKTTFFHLIVESLKVIIKGKVYVVRAKEVTRWVPDFREENLDESEDYSDNNSISFVNQQKSNKVAHEMNDSNPKFPPGFTPQHSEHYEYKKVEALRESTTPQDSKKVRNDQTFHQVLEEPVNKSSGVSKSAHADSMAGPVKQRNGFSILECFQEFIDIGKAMGYKMKGCEKDFRRIITSLGDETKIVYLDVFVVKNLWGYMLFDFATSSARGRSGSILRVWDKLLFHKKRTYATEHCLCVDDTWMANNANLLFISVYSPQELSLKRVLWNYMLETLNRWHGEVIIIGDFNERLKEWSSIKRRNKDHDRKVIQDSFIEIDLRLDKGNGLLDDLTKRANLFRDLKDIDHKDSIDLAQKAKIKWAVEGDENSKFFHCIVNKKRRHLAIKGILVDGEWIENPNRVKSEFYSYYSNLFSAPTWDRSLFDVNFLRRLNFDQVFDLKDMTIVGGDVTNAIKEFSSLALSPKAEIPLNVHKSSIYGVGVRQADVQHMAENFGCLSNNIPFTYLDVKVGANMMRPNSWSDVVKKVSNKLSNGKPKPFLSGEKFKRLFNLELQKDANVASKLQASNVASSFRRPPRPDDGTFIFQSLMIHLHGIPGSTYESL
nr:RNA-directed DNA polymerase, eukaryota [Tanacetum cinerariifolium]